jgi:hypothetical protein
MNELEVKLIALVEAMGISVDEYVNQQINALATTVGTDVNGLSAKIAAIDTALDGINDGSIDTTAIQSIGGNIVEAIAANNTLGVTNQTAIANLGTALNSALDALTGRVNTLELEMDAVEGRLDTVEATQATQGAAIVSVEDRATALEGRATATEAKDAAQDARLNALETGSATNAQGIADLQAELDATQAGAGLNPDGSFETTDGSDSLYEYIQDVDGDANNMRKALRKIAKKSKQKDAELEQTIGTVATDLANEVTSRTNVTNDLQNQITDAMDYVQQFGEGIQNEVDNIESAVGLSASGNYIPKTGKNYIDGQTSISGEINALDSAVKANFDAVAAEQARAEGAEAGLQSQIDTLAGTGTGSLGDLEARVTANEQNISSNDSDIAGLQNDKLDTAKVTSLDITSIENKFRAKLGLSLNS